MLSKKQSRLLVTPLSLLAAVVMFVCMTTAAMAQDAATLAKSALQKAQQKDLQGALADITKAAQLAPKNSQVLVFKGQVELALDKKAEAKSSLTQALEANPGEVKAYVMLAQLAMKTGNASEATQWLQKGHDAVTDVNMKFNFKVYLAKVYNMQQQYQQALTWLQQADAIKPDDPQVVMTRLQVLEKMEKWPEAVQNGQAAAQKMAPNQQAVDYALYYLSYAQFKAGDAVAANASVDKIQTVNVKNAAKARMAMSGSKVQIFYAMPYIQVGDWNEAKKYLDKAIEIGDEPGQANMYMGMMYMQQGDKSQAAQYLKKASEVEKDPAKLGQIQNALINLQFQNKDYDGVIKTASALLAKNPANAQSLLFMKAKSEYQVNRFGDAVSTLQQAVKMTADPKQKDMYYFLMGLAAKRNGNNDIAKSAFAEIKNNPFKAVASKLGGGADPK